MFNKACIKGIQLFAAGAVAATAGVKALKSKDAKKVYTKVTAAGLRVKDCVVKTANDIQDNAQDIVAEAKQYNDELEKEEIVEDKAKKSEK